MLNLAKTRGLQVRDSEVAPPLLLFRLLRFAPPLCYRYNSTAKWGKQNSGQRRDLLTLLSGIRYDPRLHATRSDKLRAPLSRISPSPMPLLPIYPIILLSSNPTRALAGHYHELCHRDFHLICQCFCSQTKPAQRWYGGDRSR